MSLAAALLTPFVLIGGITKAVAHAGFRIDPMYSGGTLARTDTRNGYTIAINKPVHPRALERGSSFVQVTFSPVSALPAAIDETIDLDGDGKPDVRVDFSVPHDEAAPLHGNVQALDSRYRTIAGIGKKSISELLVRTDDKIVLRVPMTKNGK